MFACVRVRACACLRSRADCVHYCMPGVPDDFATLVFNVLHSEAANGAAATHPKRKRLLDGGGVREGGNASWSISLKEWLSVRGVSRFFEGTAAANAAAGAQGDTLEEQAWWPFSASLGCSRFLGSADADAHRSYIASLDRGAEIAAASDSLRANKHEGRTHARTGPRSGRRSVAS